MNQLLPHLVFKKGSYFLYLDKTFELIDNIIENGGES